MLSGLKIIHYEKSIILIVIENNNSKAEFKTIKVKSFLKTSTVHCLKSRCSEEEEQVVVGAVVRSVNGLTLNAFHTIPRNRTKSCFISIETYMQEQRALSCPSVKVIFCKTLKACFPLMKIIDL